MARYYWIQTLLKQIQMFTSLHEIEVTTFWEAKPAKVQRS